MFEAFNAQPKNVADLLSDSQPARIVVPRFQRGYSWEKKHVESFWNDVRAFQVESSVKGGPDKYFLGPIVVMSAPESKEIIYLLDGQQRLATATILLSVIRDLAHELSFTEAEVFARDIHDHLIMKEDIGCSLELGELDKGYFIETIQNYPRSDRKASLRSHRNIRYARDILAGAVAVQLAPKNPVEKLAELKKLRKTLRNELIMACIPVASQRDAFRIFETLNDRGLRLSVPDLLLNYLMGEADSDTSRGQVRDSWNEMIEGMGRRDINHFFRHMWVSKYGDLKSIDLFTALKDHIKSGGTNSVEFAGSCAQECRRYVELWNADTEHLGKAAQYVRALVRDLGFESALPLLMSAHCSFVASDLEAVARWLLVFVVRYSIIVKLDSSGMETIFFALARDIRAKMAANGDSKSCLNHIKENLVKKAPSDGQIEASIDSLVLDPSEAQYLLTKIATRMETNTKEVKIDESNLEHVFPKKPSPEWLNQEQLEPYLWQFGNLTVLGERLNNAVANKGYTSKREHYRKASELAINQEIAKLYDHWDEATIRDRAKKLCPYIREIWNFDNPSRV